MFIINLEYDYIEWLNMNWCVIKNVVHMVLIFKDG